MIEYFSIVLIYICFNNIFEERNSRLKTLSSLGNNNLLVFGLNLPISFPKSLGNYHEIFLNLVKEYTFHLMVEKPFFNFIFKFSIVNTCQVLH